MNLKKIRGCWTYATSYGNALIKIQRADGFFPAWLSIEDQQPLDKLDQSPETSMSVTFLMKLFRATKNAKYKTSALKAMQAVMKKNIPAGQWEDFETYWSCSRYGSKELVGKKVARNDMFKQNNFSMYWTAEALLICYRTNRRQELSEIRATNAR